MPGSFECEPVAGKAGRRRSGRATSRRGNAASDGPAPRSNQRTTHITLVCSISLPAEESPEGSMGSSEAQRDAGKAAEESRAISCVSFEVQGVVGKAAQRRSGRATSRRGNAAAEN